jgi:hypothetical protein
MGEAPERPEAGGGFEPPPGAAGGGWLPPVPPGAQPARPPGWRISPRAVDLDPDAPSGPEPWSDPGNSVAGPALGVSVAAAGLLFFGVGIVSLPLAILGTILSAVGRGRIKRGETRQGKVEVGVGLAVGIGTIVISAIVVAVYIATR